MMIDIGTTTLQAALHLRGRDITVVTTSLAVYEELVPDPALLLPGGVVRRNHRSLVGVPADAEKFAMAGLVRVCDARALERIVTDAPLPAACRPALEDLEDLEIEVTVA